MVARSLLSPDEVSSLRKLLREEYEERLLEAYRHRCEVELGPERIERVTSIPEAEKLFRSKRVEIPFLQLFNTWRSTKRDALRQFVLSPSLASIAADLLGSDRVCLYQDSLFVKRPGDGPTQWHSDLNLAPLDTNNFVTVWIPLSDVPELGSALQYASASHRDFALNHWRSTQQRQCMDLSDRYEIKTHGKIWAGDTLWHHGWCLHMAPGVPKTDSHHTAVDAFPGRAAFAISYFSGDGDTRVLPRKLRKKIDSEDQRSYSDWIKRMHDDVPIMGQHVHLPCIFKRNDADGCLPPSTFDQNISQGEDVDL